MLQSECGRSKYKTHTYIRHNTCRMDIDGSPTLKCMSITLF